MKVFLSVMAIATALVGAFITLQLALWSDPAELAPRRRARAITAGLILSAVGLIAGLAWLSRGELTPGLLAPAGGGIAALVAVALLGGMSRDRRR